jgi:MFS family permease
MLVRFADRAGKGIRDAPRDTLVAQASAAQGRGRAYGFQRAMDNGGAVLGPLAAYLMLHGGLSIRTALAWTAIPGALALLAMGVGVAEVGARPAVHARLALGLPPSRIYRRVLFALFVFALGSSSDAFLLWRAREIGIPAQYAPVLWMLLSLVKTATSAWGGALSDRAGRRLPILAGWTVYAVVYLGFGLAAAAWQIWALFALYGSFFGLTEGPERALVVDLVEEEWRGRALGAYHAARGIATLAASLLFGVVYQSAGAKAAFTMGASIAMLAVLVLPRRLQPPGS